jgi:high-affinity nickel-transport protein
VALLVLATIPTPAWAIAYLLVFGLGTIVGMIVITALIALPVAFAGRRRMVLQRGLRVASGLLSLGFGLFLAYHIGVVQGLFTGRPEWTPH